MLNIMRRLEQGPGSCGRGARRGGAGGVLLARLLRLMSLAAPALGLALPAPGPALLWNTTASAPVGFYRLAPARRLHPGQWAALRPPPALASWLARAGYLPKGALLLKRITAGPGARVCRAGERLLIDGRLAAYARRRDGRGRPLPAWRGCRTLQDGEIFLLNLAPDSLDGRYFGSSRASDVVALATPLWTWSPRA